MIHVSAILDTNELEFAVAEGFVSKRKHPTLPLYIYNYTPKALFDWKWTEVTEVCRGLILDESGTVISRPFRKFFCLNTEDRPETYYDNLPRDEQPEVYDKADGSLGILYAYNGEVGIATRGSFISEQAIWATRHLHAKYPEFVEFHAKWKPCAPLTYVFEIIYGLNRIVVDYDYEDLVLLSIINTLTGKEFQRASIEGSCYPGPKVQLFKKTLTEAMADEIPNKEGYVLFYRNAGLRLKVKFDEYMRIHRLITGVSPRYIWELLRDGNHTELEALVTKVPDSFVRFVSDWKQRLLADFNGIIAEARKVYDTRPLGKRSEIAEHFKKYPKVQGLAFGLLDANGVLMPRMAKAAWVMVRPKVSLEDVYRKDDTDS